MLPIHGSPCLAKQFLLSVSSRTGSARRPRRTGSAGDKVSRAEAWHQVADCLEGLVRPDDVVTRCEVEVISEDDFSYAQYRVSESLNFEAMSGTSVRPEHEW